MITFDATSSLNQTLVNDIISASSTSGTFSVQDFETELTGLISQVIGDESATSSVASATSSSTAASTLSTAPAASGDATTTGTSTSQDSGATNSSAAAQPSSTAASTPPAAPASSVTPSTNAMPGSAASNAALAAAEAISPVAAAFGITSLGPPAPVADEVVQSGDLTYSMGDGFPKATASTPVLDTLAEVIAKNLANNGPVSGGGPTGGPPMVQMWDPWNHTEDGPDVPASGIMITNPTTGQQVDSASVFSAYQNYYGSNPQQLVFNLGEECGLDVVKQFEQQNPSFNPLAGSSAAPPTVFDEIGPYNPFYDPNNGGQLCIFDSTGTEYLI
jgi:hypothetical protein